MANDVFEYYDCVINQDADGGLREFLLFYSKIPGTRVRLTTIPKPPITIPNERWQSQQRAAWAKLARSEAPDKQVEASTQEMITGREWLFQQEYPGQSPVQKAVRDWPRRWR
jgi:hypothetical protein